MNKGFIRLYTRPSIQSRIQALYHVLFYWGTIRPRL